MGLDDNLEEEFNQAVQEWKAHCEKNSIHSMPQPYLDCEAFRKIVNMGPKVLPLIREEYSKPQEIGDPGIHWCYAIHEIIPDFKLPIGEKGSGEAVEKAAPGFVGLKVEEVQQKTVEWLDENMDKYI